MADTPKKTVPQNCCVCDRKRFYSLHGDKCSQLSDNLSILLDVDFKSFLQTETNLALGICRTCYDKVFQAKELLDRFKQLVSGNTVVTERVKRMAKSPLTPEVAKISSVKKRSSQRCLQFQSYSKPSQIEHTQQPESVQVTEHGYCKEKTLQKHVDEKTDNSSACLNSLHKHLDGSNTDHIKHADISDIVETIFSTPAVLKAVEQRMLEDIANAALTLTSRNVAVGSVLSRYRSLGNLVQYGDQLFNEVICEMSNRVPFVLDMFSTLVCGEKQPNEHKIAPIVAAYAVLMNARNDKLTAWHRLTTLIAIKGHLDDSALTRLNHLGVAMSCSTKLRLLDEAGDLMDTGVIRTLSSNPLIKITGDNLDIYIKTGHKSLDKSNRDLHLFASNIIFSRVAKPGLYSNTPITTPLEVLRPDKFIVQGHYKDTLINSYCIQLGRILCDLKEFSWLKSVLPSHIHHPYQLQMSQKSTVYQLPIMMKNEAKHEDCVDILDNYEAILSDIFTKTFGSEDLLNKYKVPVGGDQLTRVRLAEAQNLRSLATTAKKRFEDLHPFIIELWHVKQDFLEKCFKELYDSKTLRQPGTLFHYKSKLQRSDISGKVKGAFKAHRQFLLLVGKEMITEQFLEYFGMEDELSKPTRNVPAVQKAIFGRRQELFTILQQFMAHYGYLGDPAAVHDEDDADRVYNYSCNLCHWVLQLINMEDIVSEGDPLRLIPSLMYNIPFFFSHSRLSKYFEECLDFILKCEYILSPLQRMRVLEGAFTNLKGGSGNNIESDLVQENSVRNQKDLIRSLGANKTDIAIERCTKAANTIANICDNVDATLSLKKTSTHHHKPKAVDDEKVISKSLRQLRPFKRTSGRVCQGLPNILSSPLQKIDANDFKSRIQQVITRLYHGQTSFTENDSSDEEP